jgi:hypothetical protein
MVFFSLAATLLLTVPMVASAQAGTESPTGLREPAAQSPQVGASLRALLRLVERAPVTTIGVRTTKPRATTALHTLLTLSANWPAQSPSDYRAHLARKVRLFERALATDDPAHLDRTFQAIADDLEIKLEHSRLSGGRLGGSVVVRVRALLGPTRSGISTYCALRRPTTSTAPPLCSFRR